MFWVVYILVSAAIVETLITPILFPTSNELCNDPAFVDSATCTASLELETSDLIVRGLAIANLAISSVMPIAVVRAKVIPQRWMFAVWCAVAFIVTGALVSWIAG